MKQILNNRWLRLALLGASFIAATWLLFHHPEQLELLLQVDPGYFIILLCITFVSFCLTATASWYLLRVMGSHIRWGENLSLTFLANFLNYFAPSQPGLYAKAIYLKRVRATSYTNFAVMTATNALMMLGITGATSSMIILILWLVDGVILKEIGLLSFLALTVFLVMPIIVRYLPQNDLNGYGWRGIIQKGYMGLHQVWNKPKVLTVAGLIIISQYLVSALSVRLCYGIFGDELDYLLAFLVAAFLSVANLFPITPNNVGIAELLFAAAAELSGANFSTGLIAASLMRALHLVSCFIAIPFADMQLRQQGPLLKK